MAGSPAPSATSASRRRSTEARSRRLLGLGLQGLARRLLSREAPAARVAAPLRRALRHGRDQLDLLPAANRGGGQRLGRADAEGVSLLGQGEPLHHSHQAAQQPGEVRRALPRVGQAADDGEQARRDPLAAAAELQAKRRAPRRGAHGDPRPRSGPPRGRAAPSELVHQGRVRAAGLAQGGAGDRRRPEVPVRGARADDVVDLRAHAPRQRGAAAATRRPSSRPGSAASRRGGARPTCSSTSTTPRSRSRSTTRERCAATPERRPAARSGRSPRLGRTLR